MLAVTAVVAVVAVILGVQANHARKQADTAREQAVRRRTRPPALRLVAEAQPMLAGTRSGGHVRALQQLLRRRRLAPNAG